MSPSIPNQLDLTPLANATQRLAEGIARYQLDVTDTQIRDGLIQRFEFTYEIAHKTLKRFLEQVSPTPDAFDAMPFADLIRSANEQNLLQEEWPQWKLFREMRGKTSHTYNETTAIEVVTGIPGFLREAQYLLGRLTERAAR